MSQTLWIILGMAAVTYATRATLLLAGGRVPLPARLEQALRYLPVAILTAIIAPALLVRNHALALTWHNDYLWAGIVCTVVAWRTRNVLWTVLTGLLFVLAWRALGL